MEQEQIIKMCDATDDKPFQAFLRDEGWKYDTEDDILTAYARKVKSYQGTPLTEDECLAELGTEYALEGRQLYTKLHPLVQSGALKASDLYKYARFKWCLRHPDAVIACETGPKRWVVNNCGEEISTDRAKQIISNQWGFDIGRIEILSTPYYDATDWNFIRFRCANVDWVMHNDSLDQIYQ